MDRQELEQYQAQLAQVNAVLEEDAENEELQSLRTEIVELIDLAQKALAQEAIAAARAKASAAKAATGVRAIPQADFKPGGDVDAKYSRDGHWYPAKIIAVGGSESNRVYTVLFKGYSETEIVKASEIRASTSTQPWQNPHNDAKRKLSKEEEEERERKKKRNEKKLEVRAHKAKEQQDKQQAWMKFAKKSEKKGIEIAGMSGRSIFKSPDNPLGRVGVTGSGKGMTSYTSMGKHKFAAEEDDE
ncbi:hypothetical protein DACRYDRAFT_24845 [Dacryopinax primogenitus]|uniref:Tudor domain-containing protein n=1 Tax=Dacryopinax primogenitus (strain DJM 731) TaxID=1858805 RepID=M5FS28_DACPD|nr:uncharacterized protein DACRYDRAFT_24845 [Dacryopinax primogenitus]EJT97924.1 hypothetical protein DACRYDRAFT_24845 [Dacryopinax primogenitus]